jgi:hypothetical protein
MKRPHSAITTTTLPPSSTRPRASFVTLVTAGGIPKTGTPPKPRLQTSTSVALANARYDELVDEMNVWLENGTKDLKCTFLKELRLRVSALHVERVVRGKADDVATRI